MQYSKTYTETYCNSISDPVDRY